MLRRLLFALQLFSPFLTNAHISPVRPLKKIALMKLWGTEFLLLQTIHAQFYIYSFYIFAQMASAS